MAVLALNKNESTRLVSEKGTPVIDISFGANWGKINRAGKSAAAGLFGRLASKIGVGDAVLEDVDLDLSLIMVDNKGDIYDTVYFNNLKSKDQSVTHTGDDRAGDDEDDGIDNEIISIKGASVHPSVVSMFAVLNNFSHQKFDEIPYMGLSVYEGFVKNGKGLRIAEFRLSDNKQFKGKESIVLARLDKTNSGWEVTVIGECTDDTSLPTLSRTAIKNYSK